MTYLTMFWTIWFIWIGYWLSTLVFSKISYARYVKHIHLPWQVALDRWKSDLGNNDLINLSEGYGQEANKYKFNPLLPWEWWNIAFKKIGKQVLESGK